MNIEERQLILNKAKKFFQEEIINNHLDNVIHRASRIEEYNIQPFLIHYLSNFLEGNANPESMAKALIYPRVLGTSINTIFGTKIQKMINEVFPGFGSAVNGIDIEFIDSIDNRKKYCQVKSGPNTINKDDVTTIIDGFKGVRNLARVNNLEIALNDLIVGVLYGTPEELSNHYKKINQLYPVLVGSAFWYHLTGQDDFYIQLINCIGETAKEVDGRKILNEAITKLAGEIERRFK